MKVHKFSNGFKEISSLIREQIKQLDQKVISPPWSDQNWDSCSTGYLFYILEGGKNEILGFMLMNFFEGNDQADLLKIAVNSQHQKKGLGLELLSFGLKDLRYLGVKQIYLEVREDNKKAMNFYYKNHFRKIRVIKDYYGKNQNALAMKRLI